MGNTQADFVSTALGATETTETSLGTITVPSQGISKIVGVWGIATIETPTAAEGASGYYRLSFTSVSGVFRFPATIFLGPAGTLADIGGHQQAQIIPVEIQVPPNEAVTIYMALLLAQTGACEGMAGLIME